MYSESISEKVLPTNSIGSLAENLYVSGSYNFGCRKLINRRCEVIAQRASSHCPPKGDPTGNPSGKLITTRYHSVDEKGLRRSWKALFLQVIGALDCWELGDERSFSQSEEDMLNQRRVAGFTLFEMLLVLALTSILSYIGVSGLKNLASPIQDATTSTVSFLKVVRARALATTSSYTVYPISSTRLGTRYSASCEDDPLTMTTDSTLLLQFPAGASLESTSWTVCFTARGLAFDDATLAINGTGGTRKLEVLLGGSVRVIS